MMSSVRKAVLASVAAIIIAGIASCTEGDDASEDSAATIPSPSRPEAATIVVDDLASFMHALESSGLKARQVKPVPGWEPIFGVRGHLVSIEGNRVTAFEYETAKAAERLQASVSKDGGRSWGRHHRLVLPPLLSVHDVEHERRSRHVDADPQRAR
jgi:hypothetical protein